MVRVRALGVGIGLALWLVLLSLQQQVARPFEALRLARASQHLHQPKYAHA